MPATIWVGCCVFFRRSRSLMDTSGAHWRRLGYPMSNLTRQRMLDRNSRAAWIESVGPDRRRDGAGVISVDKLASGNRVPDLRVGERWVCA